MARDYKKEYEQAKKLNISGPGSLQHERQRARRLLDKTGKDENSNGKADAREGKDIAHKRALSKGGKNSHGYEITSASANRSFLRDSSKTLVSEKSKRERKKT